MFKENTNLKKEDFDLIKINTLIDKIEKKDCKQYYKSFSIAAKDTKDEKEKEILGLFEVMTSLGFNPDNTPHPFIVYTSISGIFRGADITDIKNTNYLNLLDNIYNGINDNELKARITDILWVVKKDYTAAKKAVLSYIESSKILENPKRWSNCYRRIDRAMQIASSLGKNNNEFKIVIDHIESLLNKYDGNDPLFLSAKLMKILIKYKEGDPNKYIILSEKVAKKAEIEECFNRAREYWVIQSKWYLLLKDKEKARNSNIYAAETYITEAKMALKDEKRSYLAASALINRAIFAYRNISNSKQKIEELLQILSKYQSKIPEGLKIHSVSIDLSDIANKAKNLVRGKSLYNAIFDFSSITSSPKISQLKLEAESLVENHPISYLFSSIQINEHGKTTGIKPSAYTDNANEKENAIKTEMYIIAVNHRNMHTQGILLPILEQILSEHSIFKEDLDKIINNNPFIPRGREIIYLEGLYAGFQKNFLVASHLLIPQLENSIRYILYNNGKIPSGFSQEGIQDEFNLNNLLFRDDMKDIFDENTIFDLQGLLIERFGSNLRNIMAHGLSSYETFQSYESVYLWWIILKFCCMPLIDNIENHKK